MVRMTSVIYTPPVFTAFYDGRPNVAASYEDKGGIAVSFDLRQFTRVTEEDPVLVSKQGTGCLRYLSAVPVGEKIYCARGCRSIELATSSSRSRSPLSNPASSASNAWST